MVAERASHLPPLAGLYDDATAPEVDAFLRAHPALVPLLAEARPQVARYFGPDARVRLDVVTEPEAPVPDGARRLFAVVRVPTSADEAVARLDRFDEGWWLDAMARGGDALSFAAGPA